MILFKLLIYLKPETWKNGLDVEYQTVCNIGYIVWYTAHQAILFTGHHFRSLTLTPQWLIFMNVIYHMFSRVLGFVYWNVFSFWFSDGCHIALRCISKTVLNVPAPLQTFQIHIHSHVIKNLPLTLLPSTTKWTAVEKCVRITLSDWYSYNHTDAVFKSLTDKLKLGKFSQVAIEVRIRT